MTDAQQLWDGCVGRIQSQVSDATWRTWFAGIRPVGIVSGEFVLAVPNALVRERLEGRFSGLLHDALVDAAGTELPLRFDVLEVSEESDGRDAMNRGATPASSSTSITQEPKVSDELAPMVSTNTRYTFVSQ